MFWEARDVSAPHFSPSEPHSKGHREAIYRGKEQYTRRDMRDLKDTLLSLGTWEGTKHFHHSTPPSSQ
jgi:hypothetical protein